jgi:hypothetical protein
LENMADMGLAKASVPPPAGKGTIKLTGLDRTYIFVAFVQS